MPLVLHAQKSVHGPYMLMVPWHFFMRAKVDDSNIHMIVPLARHCCMQCFSLPNSSTQHIWSTDLTKLLCNSCKAIGNALGVTCSEISARALHAGGAMALLRAKVDDSTIHMMGCWKSWAMLRYLHCSATDTTTFACCMTLAAPTPSPDMLHYRLMSALLLCLPLHYVINIPTQSFTPSHPCLPWQRISYPRQQMAGYCPWKG